MKDTLGFRAKIGAMAPFTNTIVQPEYEMLTPRGVTNHMARIPNKKRPPGDLDAYRASIRAGHDDLYPVIDQLVPAAPQLILLGHSLESFAGGIKGATKMQTELTQHAKVCEVLVPSLAAHEALQALGAPKRIAILTPYQVPGDEVAEEFFSDAGYKVMKVKGLKCPTPLAIAATTELEVRNSIRELNGPDVDAIVQVGTNLPMLRVAAEAEFFLNKPVLSINLATYWKGLRHLGIKDRVQGLGRLMEQH